MRNYLKIHSFVTLGWNLVTILIGALVRATGSGAGCGSHWPLCNGAVVPDLEAIKTTIEFTHRLTSGVALILVVSLLIHTLKTLRRGHVGRTYGWISLIFILTEAALGAGLVLFELVAENDSVARAVVIVLHLVNTLLLLFGLTGHLLSLSPDHRRTNSARAHHRLMVGATLSFFFLIGATGAITALGDTLFPSSTLLEGFRADLSPTSHFLIKLRVFHPFLAVGFGIFLMILPLWIPVQASVQRALIALVLVQWGIGALNLVLLAPVWMQLLHLLAADLSWIYLVALGTDDRLWRNA